MIIDVFTAVSTSDSTESHHKIYIVRMGTRLPLPVTSNLERNLHRTMPRPPYRETRRKLVMAFDVGTTFSGVSYRYSEHVILKIRFITFLCSVF